ncbi:MAG: PadR family transcriptional regulator [Hyphomonadaceae bacterium]|nr:PadR family transcriptional regulator [Hyphomonadaceae bacterium]
MRGRHHGWSGAEEGRSGWTGRSDGDRHGRGGGRGGWGGRRYFEHGALRIIALALIAEKPRNGYEIIKAIEEKTGGAYAPSPGVVYPTLSLLEEQGHIAATEVDGKKAWAITPEGQAALDANRKIVDAFEARFAPDDADAEPQPGDVRRAVRRLINALRTRYADGDLDAAAVATLVAAINAAADAVEKA